jgi:hypothetical protein
MGVLKDGKANFARSRGKALSHARPYRTESVSREGCSVRFPRPSTQQCKTLYWSLRIYCSAGVLPISEDVFPAIASIVGIQNHLQYCLRCAKRCSKRLWPSVKEGRPARNSTSTSTPPYESELRFSMPDHIGFYNLGDSRNAILTAYEVVPALTRKHTAYMVSISLPLKPKSSESINV